MRHENFLVDHVAEWDLLEQITEEIVNFAVVLVDDFSLEAIELVQLGCLVIASAHEEVFGVTYLPGEQGHNDFY